MEFIELVIRMDDKRCTQNAIRIRYEDFLKEPTECLRMIGDKFSGSRGGYS